MSVTYGDAGGQIVRLISGYGWRDGSRRLLAMTQAFVDESVDRRVFTLAAMVGTAETWMAFSDEWKAVLDTAPAIAYFRMKECRHRGGQFASFSEHQRDNKLAALSRVMESHDIGGLICATDVMAYRKILRGKVSKTMDSPYYFTALELMVRVIRNQHQVGRTDAVDMIFDEGSGNYFREIQHTWMRLKRHAQPPEARALMGSVPIERDDKMVLPLQSADMLAWEARRRAGQAAAFDPKPTPLTEPEPFPAPVRVFVFNEHTIRERYHHYLLASRGGLGGNPPGCYQVEAW